MNQTPLSSSSATSGKAMNLFCQAMRSHHQIRVHENQDQKEIETKEIFQKPKFKIVKRPNQSNSSNKSVVLLHLMMMLLIQTSKIQVLRLIMNRQKIHKEKRDIAKKEKDQHFTY